MKLKRGVVVEDVPEQPSEIGEQLSDLLLAGRESPLGEEHLRIIGEKVQDAAAVRRHALVVERLQVLEHDGLALLVGHRHSADGHSRDSLRRDLRPPRRRCQICNRPRSGPGLNSARTLSDAPACHRQASATIVSSAGRVGRPPQLPPDARGRRKEHRRVAGAPRCLPVRHATAGHALHRRNHLPHRRRRLGAHVVGGRRAAAQQIAPAPARAPRPDPSRGCSRAGTCRPALDSPSPNTSSGAPPVTASNARGMRWISGACASPSSPSGSAPAALK